MRNENTPQQEVALTIQPALPQNVAYTTLSTVPRIAGEKPNSYDFIAGSSISYEIALQRFFSNDPENLKNKKHWFNMFFSHAANRFGFIPAKHANQEGYFGLGDELEGRPLTDFYTETLLFFDLLNNDARANVVCHKKNRSREKALEKLIATGFLLEQPATTLEESNQKCWANLIHDTSVDVRNRLLKLALNIPEALTLLLTYDGIQHINELNHIIENSNIFHIQVGRVQSETSLRDYIESLNRLTPKTRLLCLKSKNPLTQSVWTQIPKLEEFTVEQARTVLLKKIEDRSRRASLATELAQFPEKKLDVYLAETKTSFTFSDFLSMCEQQGISLKQKQLVRVNCDDFSLTDFIYFLEPLSIEKDEQKVNGLIACFFNYFMTNHAELMQTLKSNKLFYAKAILLSELLEINQTFQIVVAFAEKKLTQPLISYEFDPVTSEYKKMNTAAPEQTDSARLIFTNVRVTEEEYVITTTPGGDMNGKIPMETRESLLSLANTAKKQGEYNLAASYYCLALNLKADPVLLAETADLIITKEITLKFSHITSEILAHINTLYGELSRVITTTPVLVAQPLSAGSDVVASAVMAQNFSSRQTHAETYLEIMNFLIKLISLDKNSPHYWSVFYDKLSRFTDELLEAKVAHFYQHTLYQLWLQTSNYLRSDQDTLSALTKALLFSNKEHSDQDLSHRLSSEEREVKTAFKAWRKNCGTYLSTLALEDFFLLEASLTKFEKLKNILTSTHYFTKKEDIRQRQRILLNLPLTLKNIDIFFTKFLEKAQTYCPCTQEKLDNFYDLTLLIYKIQNKNLDINNENIARELYHQFHTSQQDEQSIAYTLLKEWIKEANPMAKFILRGEENNLREQYANPQFVFVQQENESHYPGKWYRALLKEMATNGNCHALLDLIINKRCFARTLVKDKCASLLDFMLNTNHTENFIITLNVILFRLSDDERQSLFQATITPSFQKKFRNIMLYFQICERIAETFTGNHLALAINELFSVSLRKSWEFAIQLITGKHHALIDIARLVNALKISINENSVANIRLLLELLDLYRQKQAQIKTHIRIERDLHKLMSIPIPALSDLLQTLSTLIIASGYHDLFTPVITVLLFAINAESARKLAENLQNTKTPPENSTQYTLAIKMLTEAYDDTLPKKRAVETNKEYLLRLINLAIKSVTLPQFREYRSLRTTLLSLNWINLSNEITSLAPITKEEHKAYFPDSAKKSHPNETTVNRDILPPIRPSSAAQNLRFIRTNRGDGEVEEKRSLISSYTGHQ